MVLVVVLTWDLVVQIKEECDKFERSSPITNTCLVRGYRSEARSSTCIAGGNSSQGSCAILCFQPSLG
ncbi:unnamed protein product [Discosporangium mesarthrocarpum]